MNDYMDGYLVSEVEFEDGLRRVRNLAMYVTLGGTESNRPKKAPVPYVPDFSWATVGVAKGFTA